MKISRTGRTASTSAHEHAHGWRGVLHTRLRWALIIAAMLALIAAFAPVQQRAQANGVATHNHGIHGLRVKAYYLALGDSLAYGEQPYGQPYDQGYAQQWFALLHQEGSRSLTDYGCPGVTSGGFITQLGCHWTPAGTNLVLPAHNAYEGTQLDAAVAFIRAHRNKVSPVSLDIGANDLVQALQYGGGIYIDANGVCQVRESVALATIATVRDNLTKTILPQLVQALTGPGGQRTGDLVVMNLYDPYQNACPATVPYVQLFNAMIAQTASAPHVHAPVADVFDAFGGASVPNPYIYGGTYNGKTYPAYTWMSIGNIHPTTTGYGVIARVFNRLVNDDN